MIRLLKSIITIILLLSFLLLTSCTTPGIGNNAPYITSLTANPDTISVNQTTTLTCIAYDSDGDTLIYIWNKDTTDDEEEDDDDEEEEDNPPEDERALKSPGIITGSGKTVTWKAPSTTGTYMVTCHVSDGRGGDDSTTVNIIVSAATGTGVTYSLRDIGPAGGYIFYDKGSSSDGWRYLEAAPASTEWLGKWGSYGTLIGGTKEGIGTGQSNTAAIVTWLNSHSENGCAAQLCDALTEGGYSDWFLPSKDELNLMYENLKVYGVGGFGGNYWSSSENTLFYALEQHFKDGSHHYDMKYFKKDIRAIRAF